MKRLIFKGGEGSGNRGHRGRPGQVGGSAPDNGNVWQDIVRKDPNDPRIALGREALKSSGFDFGTWPIPDDIALRYHVDNQYGILDAASEIRVRAEADPAMPIDEARRTLMTELHLPSESVIPDDVVHAYINDAEYTIYDAKRDIEKAAKVKLEPQDTTLQDMTMAAANSDPEQEDNLRSERDARQTIASELDITEAMVPDEILHRYMDDQTYTMDDVQRDIESGMSDVATTITPGGLDAARYRIASELNVLADSIPEDVVQQYVMDPHYGFPEAARDMANAELDAANMPVDTHGVPVDEVIGDIARIGQARDMLSGTLGVSSSEITDEMAMQYSRGTYTAREVMQLVRDRRDNAAWQLQHPENTDIADAERPMLASEPGAEPAPMQGNTNEEAHSYAVMSAAAELARNSGLLVTDIPTDIADRYASGTMTFEEATNTIANRIDAVNASMRANRTAPVAPEDDYVNLVRSQMAVRLGVTADSIPEDVARRYDDGTISDDEARQQIAAAAIPVWPSENAPLSNDALEPYAQQLIDRDFPVVARGDQNGDAFIDTNMSMNDRAILWDRLNERGFTSSGADGTYSMTLNTAYGIFMAYRNDVDGTVSFHAISRAGNLTEAEWANVRTNIFDKWLYMLKHL